MYIIYTDGSTSPNPGMGGAGAVLLNDKEKILIEIKHYNKYTTNNKMELYAVIMSYKYLINTYNKYILYTDSIYVQKGITEWYKNWELNNWIIRGKNIKNKELWLELISLKKLYPNVEIKWIKGHNNNKWNDYVDNLANLARTLG